MHIKIVTPREVYMDKDIESIHVKTVEGEITLLPNHTPIFAALVPCPMLIGHTSQIDEYAETVATEAANAAASANAAATSAADAGIDAANVAAQYNALETVKENANAAAAAANAAAETLDDITATATTLSAGSNATASYDSGTGVFTFGIPRGADGASGITTPINGFFTMYVEPNGDLYAVSQTDMSDAFEYDSTTGNLYYLTEDSTT